MIGIDIVEIKRMERLLQKDSKSALRRFLSDEEIALSKSSAQTVAGFYAAKEAVAKALGCGIGKKCAFLSIKIHKDENNAPYFTLDKTLIEEFCIKESSLSITHDGGFAIAVVYLLSDKTVFKKLHH